MNTDRHVGEEENEMRIRKGRKKIGSASGNELRCRRIYSNLALAVIVIVRCK